MPSRKKPIEATSHRFLQMLYHLGWSLSSINKRQSIGRYDWQAAPLPDGQQLLLLYMPEPLARLDSAFKNYEDLTTEHRILQGELRRAGIHARHAILLDPQGATQLIDLHQEDILLEARDEAEISDRLLPLLTTEALARGSLNAFPRKSVRQRARELEEWTRVWSNRLGASARSTREVTHRFFYWLHLARLAEQLAVGPALKVPFPEFALAVRPMQPAHYLAQHFSPLRHNWNLLQGMALDIQKKIAELAQEAGQLLPCLQSYALLSRSKFASDIFAEAFADEELRLTSWRISLIAGAIPVQEDPARWLIDPVTVDLDQVGFFGVLRQFNSIVEDLRRLAREQGVARQRGERPGLQMDLLGEDPPELTEEDTPLIALQSVLRVTTSRRERAETARFVLLAHVVEWHARLRRAEPIFPAPLVETIEPEQATPLRPSPAAADPSMN